MGGMSMAEDSKPGFSHSAVSKTPRAPAQADPLAELARLIGQDEVFDQMRRDAARATHSAVAPAVPAEPAPAPAPHWNDQGRSAREGLRGTQDPMAMLRRLAPQPAAERAAYEEPAAADHVVYGYHEAHEPQAAAAQPAAPQPAARDTVVHDAPAVYADPYYEETPQDSRYGAAAPYADEPYGEEDYVEPKPRRSWMVPMAAALGIVALGAAGVYGYRTMRSGSTGQPPVISADKSPAKIVPATTTAINDPIAAKVGADSGKGERVVPREEQPIDPMKAAGKPAGNTGSIAGAVPGTPPVAAAATTAGPNEPKKVRTLTIRPDGSVAPESLAARPPGSSGAARNTPAAAPPANLRMPPARPGSPQSDAGGAVRAAAADAPIQTASIAPMVPTRTTANPSAAGTHVVQISSQKTEADAQASFRTLQAKYPTVLGKREALIRKVELGSRGTFYRAQVGPFASSEQANGFCNELKAAGGQCMVQRN